jgi:hypothetical protein
MMKRLVSLAAIMTLGVTAALAGPVTTKDLAGHKICWRNGWTTYDPSGTYTDGYAGKGTWQVTSSGVKITGSSYQFVADIEKLPDGTFKFHSDKLGAAYDGVGQYCK